MRTPAIFAAIAAATLLSGCSFERHGVLNPGENQVFRVESGDRHFFKLEERSSAGYRWDCVCDDSDVEVVIDHCPPDAEDGLVGLPGVAKVMVRVHRGYDGPSTVEFKYRKVGERKPVKQFTLTLYKVEADRAFWKE